jgi:hypothetical protein
MAAIAARHVGARAAVWRAADGLFANTLFFLETERLAP